MKININKLKVGDVLIDKYNDTRTVLEVTRLSIICSAWNEKDDSKGTSIFSQEHINIMIKEYGLKLKDKEESLGKTPENTNLEKFNIEEFLSNKNIKDQTVYLVNVSYSDGNPIHRASLFIGFKRTGGYCELYNNSYDRVIPLREVKYLEIIKELYQNN